MTARLWWSMVIDSNGDRAWETNYQVDGGMEMPAEEASLKAGLYRLFFAAYLILCLCIHVSWADGTKERTKIEKQMGVEPTIFAGAFFSSSLRFASSFASASAFFFLSSSSSCCRCRLVTSIAGETNRSPSLHNLSLWITQYSCNSDASSYVCRKWQREKLGSGSIRVDNNFQSNCKWRNVRSSWLKTLVWK